MRARLGGGCGYKRAMTARARVAPKAPRERLDTDARRAQLLALGLEVFARQPYDEVSIEDLAERAAISKGLLYHYFPTKRDYYAAVVREAARQLVTLTDLPEAMPPAQRLLEGLSRYLSAALQVVGHVPAFWHPSAWPTCDGAASKGKLQRALIDAANALSNSSAGGAPLQPGPLLRHLGEARP